MSTILNFWTTPHGRPVRWPHVLKPWTQLIIVPLNQSSTYHRFNRLYYDFTEEVLINDRSVKPTIIVWTVAKVCTRIVARILAHLYSKFSSISNHHFTRKIAYYIVLRRVVQHYNLVLRRDTALTSGKPLNFNIKVIPILVYRFGRLNTP